MKHRNLDTLRSDIESHLRANGFIVFHGLSRAGQTLTEVEWDTEHHADFKLFFEVARQLDVRLIVLHHADFSSRIIEQALDELAGSSLEFEEQRQFEKRLRELDAYDGFTCEVEASFVYKGNIYLYAVRAEWYEELEQILDHLDLAGDDEDDEDPSLGGYYSRN